MSMFGDTSHGSVYLSGDGAVGPSGAKIRLFSATHLSDGTARPLVLRNGTTDAATIWVSQSGVISSTVTTNWEGGLLFTSGCFFDIGSAVSCAFEFRVEA